MRCSMVPFLCDSNAAASLLHVRRHSQAVDRSREGRILRHAMAPKPQKNVDFGALAYSRNRIHRGNIRSIRQSRGTLAREFWRPPTCSLGEWSANLVTCDHQPFLDQSRFATVDRSLTRKESVLCAAVNCLHCVRSLEVLA
ncbi:MAG: hypothetical protein MHM6MM_002947 [Cercozoa sp. M6MM]